MNAYKIIITGIVQGVGFRPFVYNLALKYDIKGFVLNSSSGVVIEAEGEETNLEAFLNELKNNHPPLAKIDSFKIEKRGFKGYKSFEILASKESLNKSALIPADIAICNDCINDFYNPLNRRYKYPFINCTNCGPRYSIIKDIPYDRKNTSMTKFKMCSECKREYSDIKSRFYHAQPISCPKCGPRLSYKNLKSNDLIFKEIAKDLKEGKIIALKGLGGFHLICDATNKDVINSLRERKKRPSKPFALMVKDLNMAKELCFISQIEERELNSIYKPIVLLKAKKVLEGIAPNLSYYGLMLPYTPIHLLLFEYINFPIVATSANISGEPIIKDIDELISKLGGVFDEVVDYNRDIIKPCDDSVEFLIKDRAFFIRKSRGFAPLAIKLPKNSPKKILALGANQKSTISIVIDDNLITSPYIGDLSTIDSIKHYKKTIEDFLKFYNFSPDIIVCDKHPNYESTKVANVLATKFNAKLLGVQHHYAHILAVMAEQNISTALGVAFDGTGFGDDKNLWGGEFLKCTKSGFEKVAHFKYFKLLGGERAIKEPRRVALSLLFESYGKEALSLNNPTIKAFSKEELNTLFLMWQKGLNAPLSSSLGRVFDAVASLLGIAQKISFEGESGILLEEFYNENIKETLPYKIKNGIIDIDEMIIKLLQSSNKKEAVSKFFNTIAKIILEISNSYDLPTILTGGVFQNKTLLKLLLKEKEFILPKNFSVNDESISIGQAYYGVLNSSCFS